MVHQTGEISVYMYMILIVFINIYIQSIYTKMNIPLSKYPAVGGHKSCGP
jgi:hypothetical protein